MAIEPDALVDGVRTTLAARGLHATRWNLHDAANTPLHQSEEPPGLLDENELRLTLVMEPAAPVPSPAAHEAERSPYREPRRDPVPFGHKRCSRCEVDYPADTEHFDRNEGKADGLDGWCKTCVGLRSKRYRQMTGRAATHRPDMVEPELVSAKAEPKELDAAPSWRARLPFFNRDEEGATP
jgi:hypothetical protein